MAQTDNLKVLWVDDQYKKMSTIIEYFDANGIELHPFDNKDSAIVEFKKEPESWDAVILDIIGIDAEHIEDGSGMFEAKDDIRDIRKLPVFFFSGQENITEDKTYTMSLKKIYVKPDDEDELIRDIKDAAGKLKDRKIKEMYPEVFSSLNFLGKYLQKSAEMELTVMNALKWHHFLECHTSANGQNILNQMRSIVDSLFTAFNRVGLIPDSLMDQYGQLKFDDCCKYLTHEPTSTLSLDTQGPILNNIWKGHLNDIKFAGNTGSHGEKPDESKARETERSVKEYLAVSGDGLKAIVTMMTCDLIIFTAKYIKAHPDPDTNKKREFKFKEEVYTVEKDLSGNLHCGPYILVSGNGIFAGRKVLVNRIFPNTSDTKYQYPFFGKYSIVE